MVTVTEREWNNLGIEMFGEDRRKWRFHCRMCHNELSIDDAEEKYPNLEGCGWRPESECIGRYTKDIDCDWCAYGLISGPVTVVRENGKEIPVFDFAGRPLTEKSSD